MFVRGYVRWFVVVLLFWILGSTMLSSLPVTATPYKKNVPSLSPAEMVSRAREWVTAQVPYNRNVQYPSERFQNYRADCSGLVTMAWGLPATPPNYGLNTTTLSLVADPLGKAIDTTGKPIISTMSQLQEGDILLNQGVDAHAILFVGWIDVAAKQVVNHPVLNNDGNYYYDGIEENGSAGKDGKGQAIEHTPDQHFILDGRFNFSQPWPYPYYPGYDSEGYYAWRFDATKAAKLGLLPVSSIHPGGQWVTPPSPKNGDTVTDVIHLVAQAYPSHQGDPAISYVFFTINSNGSWGLVCLPIAPPIKGDEFACDVNLRQLGIAYGQIQVSFNVEDQAGNMSLAPNGVHTLNHVPTATVPMPATQTSCPAQGTARAAVIEPMVLGKDQNIVYVDNEVTSNIPTSGILKRYDVTTKEAITIVNLANTTISDAQVSADGQWVLFVSFISHATAIQLVRMDGKGLQTLYCDPQGESIEHVIWSPNMQSLVFQEGEQEYDSQLSATKPSTYLLNMKNGTLQSALSQPQGQSTIAYYSPRIWLDNTRIFMIGISEGDNPYPTNIYMLDFNKETNQSWQNLQQVLTIFNDPATSSYGDGPWFFDTTPDSTKLVIGQCFACTTGGFTGSAGNPATISVQSITPSGSLGSPHILFSSISDQLKDIAVVSNQTVVFTIDNTSYRNTTPDVTRNGLWKVNLDGSGLTHIATISGGDLASGYSTSGQQSSWLAVSRDRSMFASNIFGSSIEALFFGSLSGNGTPVTFLSKQFAGQIGGISIVGWTTM